MAILPDDSHLEQVREPWASWPTWTRVHRYAPTTVDIHETLDQWLDESAPDDYMTDSIDAHGILDDNNTGFIDA